MKKEAELHCLGDSFIDGEQAYVITLPREGTIRVNQKDWDMVLQLMSFVGVEHLPDVIWRNDGERFTKNAVGMYSLNNRSSSTFQYSFYHLMSTPYSFSTSKPVSK